MTLEQFRSEEMQKLYQQYLVAGPMEYVADLFTSSGVRNARAQAVRLYATMFFFFTVFMTEQRIRKVQRSNSKRQ